MADYSREAVEFMRLVNEAESNNRQEALADLRFVYGEQWPAELMNKRELQERPCLTINKLDAFCRQVSNQQRQQRPRIKVHATNGEAQKKIADVIGGLTRHIEVNSNADTAYDTAFDHAVKMGRGYIRLMTDYCSEKSFDQEIYIHPIFNPFSVYFDPNSVEPDGSDGDRCLIATLMTKEAFAEEYPDADPANLSERGTGDLLAEWITKESVRVGEYMCVDRVPAELVKLSSGAVMYGDKIDDRLKATLEKMGVNVIGTRPSYKREVWWHKVTGLETLESKRMPGRLLPVIPVYGNVEFIDGKRKVSGIVRNAKDPQRMVNYWETAATESIALAPKAKWTMAEGQDEGHENEWARANTSATQVLRYKQTDIDGQPAPPPTRLQPEPPPVGILQALQTATGNLREVLGVVDPAQRVSGNVSGKALISEKQQSDNSTFHLYDNLTRSIKQVGRVILDWVPEVYDSQRVIRIIGDDGRPDTTEINAQNAVGQIENDVTVGEYDVIMDTGPGYNSKRQEAVEAMGGMMANEQLFPMIADLFFRNSDFPGAEVIADRLAAANPLAQIDEKSDIPPAAQMQLKQMQQQIQQLTQQLQAAGMQLKSRSDVVAMQEEGETKREMLRQTTKAHDIEKRDATAQLDTHMRAATQAQDAGLKARTAITVEELRAHVALLLAKIDERSEASREATENAV